jgi:hypothetical protein
MNWIYWALEQKPLVRTLLAVLTLLLVLATVASGIFLAHGQEKEQDYRPGIVEWNDAVAYTRTDLTDPDAMLADVFTIGFIKVNEKTILIIHNVSDGTPDRYTIIPKCWIVKIVWLKEDKEANEVKK